MSRESMKSAFPSTPLKQALQKPPVEEYTSDQVKLSELGISLKFTKIYTKGWEKRNEEKPKKVFHPNNSSFDNLTKGFWDYALNSLFTVDLLKIDTSLLPEKLAEMTLKQIEIKGSKDDSQKRIKELLDLVELLQKDGADVLELLKEFYDFMNSCMFFSTTIITCPKCKEEFDMVKDESNIVSHRDLRMLEDVEEVLEK